jgi:hypothetical protein
MLEMDTLTSRYRQVRHGGYVAFLVTLGFLAMSVLTLLFLAVLMGVLWEWVFVETPLELEQIHPAVQVGVALVVLAAVVGVAAVLSP